MQRELQHTLLCDHVLSVLNDKHPRCRRHSGDKLSTSRKSFDGDSHHSPRDAANNNAALTSNNLLSLNFVPDINKAAEINETPKLSRRGDRLDRNYNPSAFQAKKQDNKGGVGGDYTTVYMPNGQPMQMSPLNKASL